MAKKFPLVPGITLLFGRTKTVEVPLPSGRKLKTEDDAPSILVVAHGGATSYYIQDGEIWTPAADDSVGKIIDELEAADEAKRAPKF